MNISLVWSFRNRLDLLRQSLKTAHTTCPKDVGFYLVDANSNYNYTIQELRYQLSQEILLDDHRKIHICETPYRSSLSEDWNFIIFVSSDVEFTSHAWWNNIMRGLQSNPYVLAGNHAVFGLNRQQMIKDVGWFDEGYTIGPHFDCDYMIRASEAGIKVANVGATGYTHHEKDGANARLENDIPNRLPMHTKDNEVYFKKKWECSWPGWTRCSSPHPPTDISQVSRKLPEIDPHPYWTRNIVNK